MLACTALRGFAPRAPAGRRACLGHLPSAVGRASAVLSSGPGPCAAVPLRAFASLQSAGPNAPLPACAVRRGWSSWWAMHGVGFQPPPCAGRARAALRPLRTTARKEAAGDSTSASGAAAGTPAAKATSSAKDGSSGAPAPAETSKASFLKRTWEYIKKEAQHYKEGTILLYQDVRTAVPLVQRVLLGYTLSRREHNLLVRVVADMTRLVPFAFFILVPFMEFLLPIALRLFPQMLPSTFETQFQKEVELKRKLKAKIELAKVMHEAAEEMANDWAAKRGRLAEQAADGACEESARRVSEAEALRDLFRRVKAGEAVDSTQIIKFSRLFKDELTLSNMDRTQLELMCQNMGLRAFGANAFLRWQLRNRIRKLKNDDRMIVFEGVRSLSHDELVTACGERGMRAIDLATEDLRRQLTQWLELSMDQAVPITLLILANGLGHGQPASPSSQPVTAPAAAVPSTAAVGAAAEAAAEAAPEVATGDEAVEHAPAQQELPPELQTTICDLSERLVDAAICTAEAESKSSSGEELSAAEKVVQLEREMRRIEEDYARAAHEAQEADEPEDVEGEPPEAPQPVPVPHRKLQEVVEAAELLASESAVASEKEDLSKLAEVRQAALRIAEAARNNPAISRMHSRVDRLIEDLRQQVEDADLQIGERMHVLDLDGDGIISVQELEEAVKLLKGKPLERQWDAILDKVDPDHDGRIEKAQLREIIRDLELQELLAEQAEEAAEAASNTPTPAAGDATGDSDSVGDGERKSQTG